MKNSNEKQKINNSEVGDVLTSGLRQQIKDENFIEYVKPDYSKAHPMMKQQFTYEDIKDAYCAGAKTSITFESWYKTFKPEMYDKKN